NLLVEPVLLEEPISAEVPPFGAVEQEIKAGSPEGQHLIGRTAERLRYEHAVRTHGPCFPDQRLPEVRRNLVSCIAAEAVEAEREVRADIACPILNLRLPEVRSAIVQLGQVTPNRRLSGVGRVDGARRPQCPVCLANEPVG